MTMRIVTLVPSATEILFVLGAGDAVVGVSHECDFPAGVHGLPRLTRSHIDGSASSADIDAQTRQLLREGQPLYQLDGDAIAAARPDFIVTQSQCDVCAVRLSDVQQLVEQRGELAQTRVLTLNPQSLLDVLDDLYRLGHDLNLPSQAREVAFGLQRRIENVAGAVADLKSRERPRTACIEWYEPLMLSGNWVPEMLEMAGGRCELTERGAHSAYGDWEQLAEFDPEIVLLMPCGFDLPRILASIHELTSRPQWPTFTAVQRGHVYAVDGNAYFNRSGPRLVDSLEILLWILHPTRAAKAEIPNHAEGWCQL
jgi:iron complex transport system substrate-binding protein